jgi:hypothetical protein
MMTRVAKPDHLGIRLPGRPMVRPQRVQDKKTTSIFEVGAILDAWWHDGWWEGILLRVENVGRLQVYFPGIALQTINILYQVSLLLNFCYLLFYVICYHRRKADG